MSYQPGKHLIATLRTEDSSGILRYEGFKNQVNQLTEQYRLQKLGEVYHNFEPAGFTAVICLSESHISIHTWPEHNLINLDIYLSNFKRDNENAVIGIFESLTALFAGTIIHHQIITR
jgi:S-adenosylmethionine decarboxylase